MIEWMNVAVGKDQEAWPTCGWFCMLCYRCDKSIAVFHKVSLVVVCKRDQKTEGQLEDQREGNFSPEAVHIIRVAPVDHLVNLSHLQRPPRGIRRLAQGPWVVSSRNKFTDSKFKTSHVGFAALYSLSDKDPFRSLLSFLCAAEGWPWELEQRSTFICHISKYIVHGAPWSLGLLGTASLALRAVVQEITSPLRLTRWQTEPICSESFAQFKRKKMPPLRVNLSFLAATWDTAEAEWVGCILQLWAQLSEAQRTLALPVE